MSFGNFTNFNMFGLGNGYSSMGYMNFLGGSGMGSFNIGNLLGGFNMFQNCDGSFDTDAMAGYQIANTSVNFALGLVNQIMQGRQAKKEAAPKVTLESLKTKQATLEGAVRGKAKTYNTATNTYNTAVTACTTNQAKIDAYTPALETKYEAYKAWLDSTEEPKKTAPCSEQEYKAAKAAKEAADAAKGQVTKLDEAKTEAKEAMKAAKEALDAEEAKLADLEEQIKELEAIKYDDTLNKADGHGYQQTKVKDLNSLFKVDPQGNESFYSDTEKASQKNIRGAIAQYRMAQTDAEKQKWVNRICILWNNLSKEDQQDNKDIRAGIFAMSKNYPNIKFENLQM